MSVKIYYKIYLAYSMKGLINLIKNHHNLLSLTPSFHSQYLTYTSKLLEVGQLETPKVTGSYNTGQMFLHTLFGYRGVILFPWLVQVLDRDKYKRKFHHELGAEDLNQGEGVSTQTYYNVLIDSRDAPFMRAQTEAVTFLGSHESGRGIISLPGIDYVAHKDILPYKATEKIPLEHELLNKFLDYKPDADPPFISKPTLRVWQKKNQSWLQLTKVHKETTEMIRVTVMPFYMGCRMSHFWWRYNVCLENLGDLAVQLQERHWRIFSVSGSLESVRGRGVVGQEPILSRHEPVFQYSSHISLHEASGHMWGTFRMEREDGYNFEVRIPSFSLESTPGDMTTTYPD